jgi:glycosyltransferase involved in cell wall biosynthesis
MRGSVTGLGAVRRVAGTGHRGDRKKGMTVLIDAGPWLPLPQGGGGMETMLQGLIAGLCESDAVERVVVATVGDSTFDHPKIEKIWTYEHGLHPIMGDRYTAVTGKPNAHANLLARRLDQGDIDLAHFHTEVVDVNVLKERAYRRDAPVMLQTLHQNIEKFPELFASLRGTGNGKLFFNTVSEAQLPRARELIGDNVVGAIDNGIDLSRFHYPPPVKDGPFLVLAQKTPIKGQHIAARVCSELGVDLVLAGPLDASQKAWYDSEVMPYVDGEHVRDVGPVGDEKYELLARAPAYLAPVTFDEPGGISAQEALASGTPVIAMRRGNYANMIQHGVNGMLADTEEEYKRYVGQVARGEVRFDPAACRASVEHLGSQGMANRYLELYRGLIRRDRAHSMPRSRRDLVDNDMAGGGPSAEQWAALGERTKNAGLFEKMTARAQPHREVRAVEDAGGHGIA